MYSALGYPSKCTHPWCTHLYVLTPGAPIPGHPSQCTHPWGTHLNVLIPGAPFSKYSPLGHPSLCTHPWGTHLNVLTPGAPISIYSPPGAPISMYSPLGHPSQCAHPWGTILQVLGTHLNILTLRGLFEYIFRYEQTKVTSTRHPHQRGSGNHTSLQTEVSQL